LNKYVFISSLLQSQNEALEKSNMDIRVTITHELLHGFGISFTGLDWHTLPRLGLPWHYEPDSAGKFTWWVKSDPAYMRHLTYVTPNSRKSILELVRDVQSFKLKEPVYMSELHDALTKNTKAYAAAKELHAAFSTPNALVFHTKLNLDIVTDTTAPNVTVNSAVHLATEPYLQTSDFPLIGDTGTIVGRPWDGKLGNSLTNVLTTLGYEIGKGTRSPSPWTHIEPRVVNMSVERINVFGWSWNWVSSTPWTVINSFTLSVLGLIWLWCVRHEYGQRHGKPDWMELQS
jgi:hypothetical protein